MNQQDKNNAIAEAQWQTVVGIKSMIPAEAYEALMDLVGQRASLANLLDILAGGQTEYYEPAEVKSEMDEALASGWSFTGFADTFYNGEGTDFSVEPF